MSDKQKSIESRKVTTPKFRASFPQVFEAKSFQNQEAKFSIVMLFDKKKTDLSALKKAAAAAAIEKWGTKEKWPKNLRMPFRDGDTEKEDQQGYRGMTFISASSKQRPGVIDQKKNPITKEDDAFYAGCFARATLIAFAYDTAGNKGVSFSLQNLQKLGDGERFSGRRSAEEEFDEVEDDSDNPENYSDNDESDEW